MSSDYDEATADAKRALHARGGLFAQHSDTDFNSRASRLICRSRKDCLVTTAFTAQSLFEASIPETRPGTSTAVNLPPTFEKCRLRKVVRKVWIISVDRLELIETFQKR